MKLKILIVFLVVPLRVSLMEKEEQSTFLRSLPVEISQELLNYILHSSSLEESIKILRGLENTDRFARLKDPEITQQILSKLITKFPEQTVQHEIFLALALDTAGSKAWLEKYNYLPAEKMIHDKLYNDSIERHTEPVLLLLMLNRRVAQYLANEYFNEKTGNNGLLFAARKGYLSLARALLHAGADINFQSPEVKMSALMYAVNKGNLEMVKLLLAHGANPLLKNREGHSASIFARWIAIRGDQQEELLGQQMQKLLLQAEQEWIKKQPPGFQKEKRP